MRFKPFLIGFVVMAGMAVVPAQAADISPVLKAGLDFGGDTLVTVTFSDGSRESIDANDGLFFGGGVSIRNEAKTVETEVTLTYKVWDVTGSNGDIEFRRLPVDALVFYLTDKWRLGGGVTYHLNPKLDGSGVASGVDVTYKNAIGLLLAAEYRVSEQFAFGLRYTNIEYEPKAGGNTDKGNGFGLTGSFRF
jgi:hypothetical protein